MIKLWMGIFLVVFLVIGCGGTICKDHEGSVVFDWDPLFNTVDIGGRPTHSARASWVKKIIVETDGFIVVYDQKTAGFEKQPCEHDKSQMCDRHYIRSVYHIHSYTDEEGYRAWSYVPEKDWQSISHISDSVPQKPYLHIKDCRFNFLGSLLEFLLSLLFA